MVKGRNAVEGRIYSFRPKSDCEKEGITFPDLPKIVLNHMVLVLDRVPERRKHVRIMTVSLLSPQCSLSPELIDHVYGPR